MTSTNQSPQKSPITIQFISVINIAKHAIYVNKDKKLINLQTIKQIEPPSPVLVSSAME